LHWQSVDIGPFTASRNGWHGFWGVLLGLLTIALVAWVAARAYDVELPMEIPEGLTSLVLGVLILAFALIKNLTDDYSTLWSYIGIVLAAIVAYGAWLVYQSSEESMPGMGSSSSASSPSPSPAPSPPSSPEATPDSTSGTDLP
jgi:peptidoglycan/LPS O-acetylase OafA/YrhL